MVVKGYMQIAFAIHHHADDVVGILHIALILSPVQRPLPGTLFAFSQCQVSFGIVIADVLHAFVSHQGAVAEDGGIDGGLAVSFTDFHQPSA